ncbi:MAG: hypothetical protein COX19_05830, partial [Desulfobacterales bacterium CG23_combo_of_CG06-09_8_20_14_all_51_8]
MVKINDSNRIIPKKQSVFQASRWFWVFYLFAVVIGIFLRTYLISDQVIIDDEWHALNFSTNHSVWYILTHFARAGANVIPINAYVRILMVSTGWSELLLVLPSMIFGIAGLLVFPLILKRIFNSRVTIFFSLLLAFSPLLIFYSRVCRPYSVYAFLGFLGIWILYEWMLTGGKKIGLLFAVTGVLCVYFHFVGMIFVFVPLGVAVFIKWVEKFSWPPASQEKIIPSYTQLLSLGFCTLICLAIFLVPAFAQSLPNMNSNVHPAEFSVKSIVEFSRILSGNSNLFLILLFYTFAIIGLIRLFRKSFLLGLSFFSVFTAYLLAAFISKFDYAHVPLVLARYLIPAFPMVYILVALGVDSLWKTATRIPINKKVTNAVCYGLAGALL